MNKSFYDNMRFVYESEDTLFAGSDVSFPRPPAYPTGPSPDLPTPPSFPNTPPGKPGSGWTPRTPDDVPPGPPQDEILWGGGGCVDACWLLNDYAGLNSLTEGGVTPSLLTGKVYLCNESRYDYVEFKRGWGWAGSGSWPDNYNGYVMYLVDKDGNEHCKTYAFYRPRCRVPGAGFPLDARDCEGGQIGGTPLDVDQATVDTLWTRFKSCMREAFPNCSEPT